MTEFNIKRLGQTLPQNKCTEHKGTVGELPELDREPESLGSYIVQVVDHALVVVREVLVAVTVHDEGAQKSIDTFGSFRSHVFSRFTSGSLCTKRK